jgi:hypothetical protein
MTDTTQIVASKPAATSTTIQGAVIQFALSLIAVLALLYPKNAAQLNSFGQVFQGYAPMIGGVIAAVAPFVMTVLGRFKATTALH